MEISGDSIVPLDGMSDDEIRVSLEQFLTTALVIWPGNPYWQKGRTPVGALQTGGFQILLHVFKQLRQGSESTGQISLVTTTTRSEHIRHYVD